jgi:uncharacterized membrane protein
MRYLKTSFFYIVLIFIGLLSIAHCAFAQDTSIASEKTDMVKAVVLSIDKTEKSTLGFVNLPEEVQTITAEILTGSTAGKETVMTNDTIHLNVGDKFFAYHTVNADGSESYTTFDYDRLNTLLFLVILFIVILFIFGGIQGVRALASLIGSLALIFYVLLPGILKGFSPMLLSLGVASIIIVIGSFITHGFNKTTLSAVIGMALTIEITGLLAGWAVQITHLTGYASEESVYLNSSLNGSINMAGLLLGAILIGLLGVLYDIAIGQAVSVEELIRANNKISKKTLYQRATRIGKEHIGALVNTLAIAYVGVSLPLLLLLYSNNNGISVLLNINSELFATEIVRTLVGSIGLILAVPITTFVTIFILTKAKHLPETHHGHSH